MSTQGERIKKIRKELRMTQSEFGKKIGMSKQYFSKVENGVVLLNNEKLVAIGDNFNVNLNYLLLGDGEMFFNNSSTMPYSSSVSIEDIIDKFLNEKIDARLKKLINVIWKLYIR